MGVASRCGEQEVGVASRSGWNLWVWLAGGGCKEVYRFPHTTYPYSSCVCSFLQQHPYCLFIFYVFHSLIYRVSYISASKAGAIPENNAIHLSQT